MYSKIGHLNFQECNDGDLAEWMVYTGTPFTMKRQFWTNKKSDTAKDLQATV